MNTRDDQNVRDVVRERYAEIATSEGDASCAPGCCGDHRSRSQRLGYSEEELAAAPEGANLGLGCGNPQAIAALREGQTVLDLGSGGGLDCFLAARQVGATGRVIGVDMTAEMVSRARAHAAKMGMSNVAFRLGEIEHLPVADDSVDVILSNCVINLSPDKEQVFRDAFRVLRPGGRLAISDVVALDSMPEALRDRIDTLTGCAAGAIPVAAIETILTQLGYEDVTITVNAASREFIGDWFPGENVEDYVASATIQARKPGARSSCCGS
ncbi:MAG: arsenite methyltransferase [Planctomycetes bacterium]|nr:arsenite methyltransferase [Planctomycetota bacterium]